MRRITGAVALVLMLAAPSAAFADYETAVSALKRGAMRIGIATLRAAAYEGDARAQNLLGTLFEDGDGVTRDFGRAVYWYRKAAEEGDADGQLNLGRMYRGGMGVERNDRRAVFWYRGAARQGNAMAQFFLGVMHESGQGVERDPIKAWMWFSLAAEQGDEDAEFRRDWLATQLAPDALAAARAALGREREPAGQESAPAPLYVTKVLVRNIEQRLARLGYDPGEVDGRFDARTRHAIDSLARAAGLVPTGRITSDILSVLEEREAAGSTALRNGSRAAARERAARAAPKAAAAVGADAGEKDAAGAPRGDPVVFEIQTTLLKLGYSPGPRDGQPGSETHKAVRQFEREQGHRPRKKLDEKLLSRLRDALEAGKPARSVVREIQKNLGRLGYPAGPVDGVAGPRTVAAAERFQRDRGLPVDGRLSVDLLEALRRDGA